MKYLLSRHGLHGDLFLYMINAYLYLGFKENGIKNKNVFNVTNIY